MSNLVPHIDPLIQNALSERYCLFSLAGTPILSVTIHGGVHMLDVTDR
jgi:hypothetical protein